MSNVKDAAGLKELLERKETGAGPHPPRAMDHLALAIIALLLVVGKLGKHIAGEGAAFATMPQVFAFAATFYRAGISPKRLVNLHTAAAIHFLPVVALTTQNTAS